MAGENRIKDRKRREHNVFSAESRTVRRASAKNEVQRAQLDEKAASNLRTGA